MARALHSIGLMWRTLATWDQYALAGLLLIVSACGAADELSILDPVEPIPAQTASGAADDSVLLQPLEPLEATTIADVAEASVGSVVNVASERVVRRRHGPPFDPSVDHPFFHDPFFERFFGDGRPGTSERRERSLGSGVIVDATGIVLTNHHVVASADSIIVALDDGREFSAELAGSDARSDIAVLRLLGDVPSLDPLRFGDSEALRLGDVVIAIGNPFGLGQTVTMGIVSATGRANVGIVEYEDFIQTDAAINPGNSGGALVNAQGELVGINTAILSRSGGYDGVGFAVPSNMARSVMNSLLATGRVERGWLGVGIQEVTPDLAEALRVEQSSGVVVSHVDPESPADAAGLERGDVIVAVDGEPIESTGRLRNRLAEAGAGTTVALELVRGEAARTVLVELGIAPSTSASPQPEQEDRIVGMRLRALDDSLRERFGIPEATRGVIVEDVAPASMAARAGIRAGDLIREVGGAAVTSVAGFRRALDAMKDHVALVLVERSGSTFFVTLRPEAAMRRGKR